MDEVNPYIRHQVMVQRLAAGEAKEIFNVLDALTDSIIARLALGATDYQEARLTILLNDIRDYMQSSGVEISERLNTALTDFAQHESDISAKILAASTTVQVIEPAVATIIATVTDRPAVLVQGRTTVSQTVAQMVNTFTTGREREILSIIRGGAIEGATVQQVSREVRRIVENRTRRQAETLVRTAFNHISNEARLAVFEENANILAGERYVATLDGRTTITCASLDGKIFPVGTGPKPPLHYSCRSTRIAVVNTGDRAQPVGERASMGGPVDSRTTYGGWLKRQSNEFQDEVLGEERAALFRSGKVSIDRFTDDRGVVYTLDQLKQREGLLFN